MKKTRVTLSSLGELATHLPGTGKLLGVKPATKIDASLPPVEMPAVEETEEDGEFIPAMETDIEPTMWTVVYADTGTVYYDRLTKEDAEGVVNAAVKSGFVKAAGELLILDDLGVAAYYEKLDADEKAARENADEDGQDITDILEPSDDTPEAEGDFVDVPAPADTVQEEAPRSSGCLSCGAGPGEGHHTGCPRTFDASPVVTINAPISLPLEEVETGMQEGPVHIFATGTAEQWEPTEEQTKLLEKDPEVLEQYTGGYITLDEAVAKATLNAARRALEEADPEVAEEEDDEDLSMNMADLTRDQVMKEIARFYHVLNTTPLEAKLSQMDDNQLKDHLWLLRTNNGGSLDMAEILSSVEADYNVFLNSDKMRDKMKLVSAKASDHLKVLQRLQAVIGSDVTVNGVRYEEYTAMLKSATVWLSLTSDYIYKIAEKMGITIPVDEAMPNALHVPIIPGLPANPKVMMHILAVFYARLTNAMEQNIALTKAQTSHIAKINDLVKREAALKVDVESQRKRVTETDANWRRQFDGETVRYCIRDQNGKLLRKINPDERLSSAKDLDLRGTFETAFYFTSKTAANELVSRLSGTHRFRQRTLSVSRIAIVDEPN